LVEELSRGGATEPGRRAGDQHRCHRQCGLDVLPAVDDEGAADGERGVLGAQPQDSGGDLLGRPMRPMGSCAITAWRRASVPPVKRSIVSMALTPGEMEVDDDLGGEAARDSGGRAHGGLRV
jgi:hypothetical protein